MATPADRRLQELLEKWLESLELHLNYVSLDDASYASVQPWPKHQRPSRWIIELAKQKAVALQGQLNDRVAKGDVTFSDALELMAFLSNLLAAEHIARFIPLANAGHATPPASGIEAASAVDEPTGTREMPKFLLNAQPSANGARGERPADALHAEPRAAPAPPARTVPIAKQTAAKPATLSRPANPGKAPASAPTSAKPAAKAAVAAASAPAASIDNASLSPGIRSAAVREQVIADAARLMQWGRKWYELAELIAGMADRPSVTDVRRILKDNKTVIDKKAGRG